MVNWRWPGVMLALLFLCGASTGQSVPLEITGGNPTQVEVEQITVTKVKQTLLTTLPFQVTAPAGGFGYSWDFPEGVKAKRKGRTLEIVESPKGGVTITVSYSVVDFEKKTTLDMYGEVTVQVGEIVPPKPPEPPAPPVPPTPPPDPAPIPVPGFRVLILYESGDTMPAEQSSIITAASIRAYIKAKSPLGPDGQTPDSRFWDKDVDVSSVSDMWRNAVTRARSKSNGKPWIMISNGKTGYEGPLPANTESTLKLMKQFGGD